MPELREAVIEVVDEDGFEHWITWEPGKPFMEELYAENIRGGSEVQLRWYGIDPVLEATAKVEAETVGQSTPRVSGPQEKLRLIAEIQKLDEQRFAKNPILLALGVGGALPFLLREKGLI